MNSAIDLSVVARRQLADYDDHRPGHFFHDAPCELNISQAYEVQKQVAALRASRGETVVGYKTGCVSEVVRRQLGIDRPVFGYVFQSELHPTAAELDMAHFDNLAIEGEFAVRMAADVPDPEWLAQQPIEAIGAVLAVIELHNNVFRGPRRTAAELIANNALHAGVVLPDHSSKSLDDRISIYRNGVRIGLQAADALPGGLWASLIGVARHAAAADRCLRRGDLVLTGSPLPLYPVEPGDSIMVRSEHCGDTEAIILSTSRH